MGLQDWLVIVPGDKPGQVKERNVVTAETPSKAADYVAGGVGIDPEDLIVCPLTVGGMSVPL